MGASTIARTDASAVPSSDTGTAARPSASTDTSTPNESPVLVTGASIGAPPVRRLPSPESRVLVTGAAGFVGRAVVRELGSSALPRTRAQLDLSDLPAIERELEHLRPWAVINAAALADVDRCEQDPASAIRVNAEGPAHLARICSRLGIRLIHISTDYVFGGSLDHPLRPEDERRPLSQYGISKAEGEVRVLEANPDAIIARVAWVYGRYGKGFGCSAPIRLARGERVTAIADRYGHPTYVGDAARTMIALLTGPPGIYHVVNGGPTSWLEFTIRLAERLAVPADRVVGVSRHDLPPAAPRPVNTVLEDARLRQLGLELRPWQEAQDAYLRELVMVGGGMS